MINRRASKHARVYTHNNLQVGTPAPFCRGFLSATYSTLIWSMSNPIIAASLCGIWSAFRVMYTVGYTTGDPKKVCRASTSVWSCIDKPFLSAQSPWERPRKHARRFRYVQFYDFSWLWLTRHAGLMCGATWTAIRFLLQNM